MKGLVRLGILLGVCGVVGVACQKTEAVPPSITGCTGDATKGCGQLGPGTGGPEGGDAKADAPEASSDVAVTLTGKVFGIESNDFRTTVPYTGTATITTEHASGVTDQVTYDGTSYSFPDAPYTSVLWVLTEPQQGGAGAPYLPTLVPVDTTAGGAVDLVIVAGSVIDQIYSSVTLPLTRQLGTAQLVLRFVDATGKPAPGRSITTAAAATIIYSAQGSWDDTGTATDNAAVVLLPNVNPGLVPVSIDNSQGASVEAKADTVTLATLQVH